MRNLEFTRMGSAFCIPWYVTRICVLVKRIWGIQEAAAFDPEKLVAPKELWPLSQADELDKWFEERRKNA